jgi:hypothetical protein
VLAQLAIAQNAPLPLDHVTPPVKYIDALPLYWMFLLVLSDPSKYNVPLTASEEAPDPAGVQLIVFVPTVHW